MAVQDKNQDDTQDTLDEVQKHLVEAARKELDRITFEQPAEELDPDQIKALVEIIKRYEKPKRPEGFGKEEFLQRFEEKNRERILNEQEKLVDLHSSQKYRTEKKDRVLRRRLFVAATSFLILFTAIVMNQVTYADSETELLRFIDDSDGILEFRKKIGIDPLKNNDVEQLEYYPLTLEEFSESYSGKFYFPMELTEHPYTYQLGYLKSAQGMNMICFHAQDTTTNKVFDLDIRVFDDTASEIGYGVGDNFILQDVTCKWDESKVYFEPESEKIILLFHDGFTGYIIKSDMELETVLNIVNRMEVYK